MTPAAVRERQISGDLFVSGVVAEPLVDACRAFGDLFAFAGARRCVCHLDAGVIICLYAPKALYVIGEGEGRTRSKTSLRFRRLRRPRFSKRAASSRSDSRPCRKCAKGKRTGLAACTHLAQKRRWVCSRTLMISVRRSSRRYGTQVCFEIQCWHAGDRASDRSYLPWRALSGSRLAAGPFRRVM